MAVIILLVWVALGIVDSYSLIPYTTSETRYHCKQDTPVSWTCQESSHAYKIQLLP